MNLDNPNTNNLHSSNINENYLRALAAQLHVETLDDKDAEDYLILLRSFEAVLRSIDNAPDYIAPDSLPQKTLEDRIFWQPASKEPLQRLESPM